MVGPVGNPQIQFSNTFKPGATPAERIIEQEDRFDETPKTNEEELSARIEEHKAAKVEERRADTTASSTRGSSLDITV